jgi:hypothetical protein
VLVPVRRSRATRSAHRARLSPPAHPRRCSDRPEPKRRERPLPPWLLGPDPNDSPLASRPTPPSSWIPHRRRTATPQDLVPPRPPPNHEPLPAYRPIPVTIVLFTLDLQTHLGSAPFRVLAPSPPLLRPLGPGPGPVPCLWDRPPTPTAVRSTWWGWVVEPTAGLAKQGGTGPSGRPTPSTAEGTREGIDTRRDRRREIRRRRESSEARTCGKQPGARPRLRSTAVRGVPHRASREPSSGSAAAASASRPNAASRHAAAITRKRKRRVSSSVLSGPHAAETVRMQRVHSGEPEDRACSSSAAKVSSNSSRMPGSAREQERCLGSGSPGVRMRSVGSEGPALCVRDLPRVGRS